MPTGTARVRSDSTSIHTPSTPPHPRKFWITLESRRLHAEFRLADGSTARRRKGAALFRYGSRLGGGDIYFAEEGDRIVLGSIALASLGLFLDPLR